jgi:hypothetical protein
MADSVVAKIATKQTIAPLTNRNLDTRVDGGLHVGGEGHGEPLAFFNSSHGDLDGKDTVSQRCLEAIAFG